MDSSYPSPARIAHIKKDLYRDTPGKGLARQMFMTTGTGLAGVLTMPLF
jgi:hypothetical protein